MRHCKWNRQEDGGISLWDLFIVTLVLLLAALLYQRGHADPYLPAQWTSAVVLGEPGAEAAPDAPATERDRLREALANATPTPFEREAPAITAVPPAGGDSADEPATQAPAPAPVQAAPPRATPPPPLTLGTLERRFWPRQVKLLKNTEFPIIFNGKVAGKASFPPGTVVALTSVEGEMITVKNGEASQRIPASDTDLLQQAEAVRAGKTPAAIR